MKILIIEDDQNISRIYQSILSWDKHELSIAGNGEEGLTLSNQTNFDLVLLDLEMPTMDGIQVLQKLNRHSKTRRPMVLVMTNLGDERVIHKAIELGADGYIIKSDVSPEQFLKKVNDLAPKTGQ